MKAGIKQTKKNDRTLLFNGLMLLDSDSETGKYSGAPGGQHRYFSSREELLQEMEKIAHANSEIGLGKIFNRGKILEYPDLIFEVEEAGANELVLIETSYETIGTVDDYEKFLGLIKKSPALLMVGIYNGFEPDKFPILVWNR